VMIAQAVWVHGYRVSMAIGRSQLSTHMYDGLAPLVRGWSKNVYAGGRHAIRGGSLGRLLFPVLLLLFPLGLLLPPLGLVVSAIALATGQPFVHAQPWLAGSVLATAGVLLLSAIMQRFNGDPLRRAWLAPLGAAVLLGICALAVMRGRNVRWKERGYRAR
jgi:hypothetical protein